MSDTTATIEPHMIPGDLLPGLLDGWIGPLEYEIHDEPGVWWPSVAGTGKHTGRVRLDTRRPEVRDHLVRVLGAGMRCECPQRRAQYVVEDWSKHWPAPNCPDCNGTGYLVAPHNCRWMLDWPGGLSAEVSAGLLWCSAVRVAAGMGPVRLGRTYDPVPGTWLHMEGLYTLRGTSGIVRQCHLQSDGWEFIAPDKSQMHHGIETGPEGRRIVEGHALDYGYALLDNDVLRLPCPWGVVALEVTR